VALLGRLSGERVRDEILKLLKARDPVRAWAAMADAGIAAKAVPEAGDVESLARLVALEAALGSAPESIRRLAALMGPQPDPVLEGLKRRLKLSNRAVEHLREIAQLRSRVDWVEQGAYRRALYGADRAALEDAALLAHAWAGRPSVDVLRAFRAAAANWRKPRFPLSGRDLEAAGVVPGPEMGRLLRALEDWWADRDFGPGRAEVLKEAQRLRATPPGAAAT
jgi:poly(A) polymerase